MSTSMNPQDFMNAMREDGWAVNAYHNEYGILAHADFRKGGQNLFLTMDGEDPMIDGLSFGEIIKIIRERS
jgi:hypothetical protein